MDGDGCSTSCREDCGHQDPGSGRRQQHRRHGCAPGCKSVEVCGNGIMISRGLRRRRYRGATAARRTAARRICGNGIVDAPSAGLRRQQHEQRRRVRLGSLGRRLQKRLIDLDALGNIPEECDDGNVDSSDNCRADCIVNHCGDGFQNTAGAVDTREDCDPPAACGAGSTCPTGFTCNGTNQCVASIGSKITSPQETSACNIDCSASACGDGKVNGSANEECDDGDTTDGDGCDSASVCRITRCGNGVQTAGEACDDGDSNNNNTCSNNCTLPACGNGVINTGETCDDGNSVNGDGCDTGVGGNCTTKCGNGV
jgi:cysteine-rich repeat protein